MKSELEIQLDKMEDTVYGIVHELKGESERAGIIIAAAKIDNQLKELLEKYLIPSYNKETNLFAFNSPLGTFSGKVNMAFALGFIDMELAKAIHFIRDLRNDCAHEIFVTIENNQSYIDKLKNIQSFYPENENYKGLIKVFRSKKYKSKPLKEQTAKIFAILTIIMCKLEPMILKTTRVSNNLTAKIE